MLPKVTKPSEKNSKSSDSESKTDKETEKSIGLKFNAEDIKFAELLNRSRKNEKYSALEFNAKEKSTELVNIKKAEHNIIPLSSRLDYKCNEKNYVESYAKGEIYNDHDFIFFLNKISTPSCVAATQDSKFSAEEKKKKYQNKEEINCNKNIDDSLSTKQKTIKSDNIKSEKTSKSEPSNQNYYSIVKKTNNSPNDRAKKKGIDLKKLKLKVKRKRIIISDSSDYEDNVETAEDTNLKHDCQVKDKNTEVDNKYTNSKNETKAKKHISEEKFHDKLNFKSNSSSKHKNSESNTNESVISKLDSESKDIEDDEDWNHKPEKIQLQNTQKTKFKVNENHISSESETELVEIVSNKVSNPEFEKVDDNDVNISHKFYRKQSQKLTVNKQCEKSESNSVEVTSSSKSSDSESEEVNKKVLRNNFSKKKLQEKSISISKSNINEHDERTESDFIEESGNKSLDSDSKIKKRNNLKHKVNKKQKTLEFNSMEVVRSNTSDSDLDTKDTNILKCTSRRRKTQDKFTSVKKSEVNEKLVKSESDSESDLKKIDETSYNRKSQLRQSRNKLTYVSKPNIDLKQEISSDSITIDSSKISKSEEVNAHTLNKKSQKRESQDKLSSILPNNLNTRSSESECDSIEVASSKNSDSETEETNKDTLNYNSQSRKSQRTKSRVNSESDEVNQNTSNYDFLRKKSQEKSSSILINNLDKKQTDSESCSSKQSESESDNVDENVSGFKSWKKNLKDKSCSKSHFPKQKRKLRNSESDSIDVIDTEVSDSESKKIKQNISKHKSPRRKSQNDLDLKSEKINKRKTTVLDSFFKKYVAEEKVSETSDISDIILELEEQDYNIDEEKDLDEEDDNIEIGNIYINRTSYWPTNQELMKLKSMRINLKHSAPPQHNIEKTSGTRNLSKEEKQEFEKYTKLKHGTFTKNEDHILKRNWAIFCKMHNWDVKNPKPFLQMKYKNKEFFLSRRVDRMRFVQFLANGLFDRSLYSVYQRFKIIFEPHKVNRYKPEEDSIILDFMHRNRMKGNDTFDNSRDRKFADLALILKRTRASVWRRYQVLQKKTKEENKKQRL